MSRLPYSRVVDVSLTRQDRFPSASGFSVLLLVQPEAIAGKVDAAARTRLYSSLIEVGVDFASASEAYRAAAFAFTQNPRPRQIKIGYRDPARPIIEELNAIYQYDPDFYWLGFTRDLADTSQQREAADWAETKTVLAGFETSAASIEAPGSGDSIAHYIAARAYDRSFAFYHPDTSLYPAVAALAYGATRDLDRSNLRAAVRGAVNSGNAYTLKFKKLTGITAINTPSAAVQAITGFVPGLGVDPAQGHAANAYVNIGGLDMMVEGTVGSRAFIDEIHAGDWIVARVQENILAALANNERVPYTNPGMGILTNAVDGAMRRAVAAGIVAGDILDNGDTFVPDYAITIDRVENIPAAQRRNRIAPDIRVDFRYSGAIHYASSSIVMRF